MRSRMGCSLRREESSKLSRYDKLSYIIYISLFIVPELKEQNN